MTEHDPTKLAHLVDSAREAGRREVYADIAGLSEWWQSHDGLDNVCVFCRADHLMDQGKHKPDCLWVRAHAAVTEGQ